MTPAEFNAALVNAEVVGLADQPELIIPLEVPEWAAAVGAVGAFRHYKGVCGPDGAQATLEQLIAHAEWDLTGVVNRGTTTQVVGTDPRFKITYDGADPALVSLFLPNLVSAAEYVDAQFNNRATINITLRVAELPGSPIGAASSTRYDIPWPNYVEGLREASDREDDDFADNLPLNSLPVRFGFPGTGTTNVTTVRVTDAQLRAIFGDNVTPETQSVSITFDSTSFWSFFGCDAPPVGGQLSLIDVAVHEITHGLGFLSAIATGGNNSNNRIEGLDVARFFQDFFVGPTLPGVSGGPPASNSQFSTFPRHGEGATLSGFSAHVYSSIPDGFQTLLEEGDAHQPSHLARREAFEDKLGVMDPSLAAGRTRCDDFYTLSDIKPLDDMGWTWIAGNATQDCNGNGFADVIDIFSLGARDSNRNLIPDVCENFAVPVNPGATFSGLTRSVWSAPGLTTLDGFNPSNFTLVFRGGTDDAFFPSGSESGVVMRFSGFFEAEEAGEYAFRVEHDEPATLRVAGQTLLAINGARSMNAFDSHRIAPQNFINLEAGIHSFELTVIMNSPGDSVRVTFDSPSIGGWRDPRRSELFGRLSDFPDCDGNLVDDRFDPDTDGDGTPDACELDCDGDGVADEIQFGSDLGNAEDLGFRARPGQSVTLTTTGSNFDTEIALYNADTGALIAANDDIGGGNFTSRIVQTLDAGTYLVGVSGWNVVFSSGPEISFPNGCTRSGNLQFGLSSPLGLITRSASIGSGRTKWYEFTVAEDCDADGISDPQERDCDGNGVPDDCEVFEFVFGTTVIGDTTQQITINTIGSTFDTEIAVWDSSGALLAQNDDIEFGVVSQSEIVRLYEAGDYLLAIAGFNVLFSDFAPDFSSGGVEVNRFGCSEGGSVSLEFGSSGGPNLFDLPPGRVVFFPFTIEQVTVGCNEADLVEPFGLLDLSDVTAFVSAFTSNDPLADLDGSGLLDLADINRFVSAFLGGCP